MTWWRDFMRRYNRANTYQAQLVSNQQIANQQAEVFYWIYRANATNIHDRHCKIGRVTVNGNSR